MLIPVYNKDMTNNIKRGHCAICNIEVINTRCEKLCDHVFLSASNNIKGITNIRICLNCFKIAAGTDWLEKVGLI